VRREKALDFGDGQNVKWPNGLLVICQIEDQPLRLSFLVTGQVGKAQPCHF
jgi:hypothetical protein